MTNVFRDLKISFYVFVLIISLSTLFNSEPVTAQKIMKVGAGEYVTTYLTSDGRLWGGRWGDTKPYMYDIGIANVTEVDGGQYSNVALTADGSVYMVGLASAANPYATLVATDNLGAAFKGNTKVYGLYQCYLTIRNGNVWYWGIADVLYMNGGATNMVPKQLTQPAGKTMVKLVPASATVFGALTYLWGLASDGTVWQWDRSHSTPFQVTFPGNVAKNITMVGPAAFVVETTSDLYAWGFYASYVGAKNSWEISGAQSIKALWQSAGVVFPIKELVGSYNTLHIIDANDNLFGSGSNPQGEVGNGIEYANWSALNPYPWQWDFGNGQMVTAPVQIPGKFKNLRTSNTITFYSYVQDMGDNWYSWGRNKSLSLGNGQTLSINDYAIYPEAMNVPAPTLVTPLTTAWNVTGFSVGTVKTPLSNAGVNQYISANSTTLYGQGSSQQNGSITGYAWVKLSGTGGAITSPSAKNTGVTSLANGTYVFQLTVTNNSNVKSTSIVTVVVGNVVVTNQAPVANAGADAVITLPAVATLSGNGTDADGTIASYSWKKVSGATGATITTATAAQTTATFTTAGTYLFELTVTDNKGLADTDTMQVAVNANTMPIANAGADRSIQLPVNSTLFDGRSSTDPNGNITTYQWTSVSGPAGSSVMNASKDTSTATFPTAGTYVYKLTVTDNGGLTSADNITVTVASAANIAPTANAGADLSIKLPLNKALLNGKLSKDTDGSITKYSWAYMSGPAGSVVRNTASDTTTVTFAAAGTYGYRLTVTDNGGLTSVDDITVTVATANIAPTANAGADISIQLPVNKALLNGKLSKDSDGSITKYSWAYISGPAGSVIRNMASDTTTATFAAAGNYVYRLTVTDNGGLTATDDVIVKVATPAAAPVQGKALHVNLYNGTNAYVNTQWNNWKPASNVTSGAFTFEDGSQSTIAANISTQQTRIIDNGTAYGTGATACPAGVLRYNSWHNANRSITITGLNSAKKYNFEFYGSRSYTTASKTIFKTGNVSDTISTDNNLTDYAKFTNIVPDASGKVIFTITFTGSYNYIAGFSIAEPSAGRSSVVAERGKEAEGSGAAGLANNVTQEITTGVTEEKMLEDANKPAIAEKKIAAQLVVKTYPNPFTSYIQVELTAAITGRFQLSLVDVSGKKVMTETLNKNSNFMMERINAAQLRPGMYLLQVVAPDGSVTTQKLIKQ